MNDIEIIELKEFDIGGAYVIDGFPSVGLVGSIAANYLVRLLDLELIAFVDSPSFPSVSLIKDGEPNAPVRIYSGEVGEGPKDKLVVIVTEFPPPSQVLKSLAKKLLDWIEENNCKIIISPEGMVTPMGQDSDAEPEWGTVFGIGTTPGCRDILKEHEIAEVTNGMVMGLAALLLNEGRIRGIDVLCILSPAHAKYPDARAAAAVISTIDQMLLQVELDIEPLLKEAEVIEDNLKEIYDKAGKAQQGAQEASTLSPIMYG